MRHRDAKALFSERNKAHDYKLLMRNTRLYHFRNNDSYIIVYHDTPIIHIFPDGRYLLNTGGWRTASTKERLNTFLGDARVRIFQKDKKWWIESLRWPEVWEFKDNIKIKDGEVC